MKTRIFISKTNQGWKELNVPDNYKRYSHNALVTVLHRFIDTTQYKGILVTENPNQPFLE